MILHFIDIKLARNVDNIKLRGCNEIRITNKKQINILKIKDFQQK